MNILFLCTSNLHRSRTAEFYFQLHWPTHHVRSAGLSRKECDHHQGRMCTPELISWAEKIFVMESRHLQRIEQHLGKNHTGKVTVLGIEDIYQFMQPELIDELVGKVSTACIAIPSPSLIYDQSWSELFSNYEGR